MTDAELLARVPLFQNLRATHLSTLAAAATTLEVKSGQKLCSADRPAPGLIVLRTGSAIRSGLDLAPGEWLDELAALDQRSAEETVVAAEDVECLVLSARAVQDAIRADPELGIALLREASRRIAAPGEVDSAQLYRYAADLSSTFREGERRLDDVRRSVLGAVRALVELAEAKHPWTRGHASRSARAARALAQATGLDEEAVGHAALGGLLHDIGYVVVDSSVFQTNGALGDAEQAQIQAHPEVGCRIVDHIEFLKPILPYIRFHHERFDGRGYPQALVGRAIPLEGRLMAVIESYEGLRASSGGRDRPQRAAVVAGLRSQAGLQLDPEMTRVFCELLVAGRIEDA